MKVVLPRTAPIALYQWVTILLYGLRVRIGYAALRLWLGGNGFGLDYALPGPPQPLPEIANLLNGNVLFGLIIGVNGLELPLCAAEHLSRTRKA